MRSSPAPDATRAPGTAEVEADYAAFVRARQRSLVGFAYVLCGDHHTAEDLVQQALARVYLKWARLVRERYNVDAYVRRAIVNEHTSLWRRAWRRLEHSTDVPPEPRSYAGGGVGSSGLARHDPAAGGVEDDTWQHVLALPTRQRAVVALRFYEDLSVAETAATLGCSEGTVKSQTSRALASLRTTLSAPDEEGR